MSPSISFKENIILEGSFKAILISSPELKEIDLLFEDHNQIQLLGANVLSRLLCQGSYGRAKPSFTNIKASTKTDVSIDTSSLLLPGDPNFPENIAEADTFISTATSGLYQPQVVTNEGMFLNPPPASGEITSGQAIAAFHHFGLYLSSFKDVEEYMFAYKYTETGFSYPSGFGLKIIWTINFNI